MSNKVKYVTFKKPEKKPPNKTEHPHPPNKKQNKNQP